MMSMEGVTTALVGFIFVCMIWKHLIQNKAQFYAGFAAVLVILLVGCVRQMVGYESTGLLKVLGFIALLAQFAGFVLLVMATGGMSLRQLGGEFGNAIEVIRRGETAKEVIIPLSSQKGAPRRRDDEEEDGGRTVYTIETAPPPPARGASGTNAAAGPAKKDDGAIPLE